MFDQRLNSNFIWKKCFFIQLKIPLNRLFMQYFKLYFIEIFIIIKKIKLKMNFFYQCQLLMIVLVIFVESIVFTEIFLRIKMKIKNLKFLLEERTISVRFLLKRVDTPLIQFLNRWESINVTSLSFHFPDISKINLL